MKVLFYLCVLVSIYFCIGSIAHVLINEQFEESRKLPENVVKDQDSQYRNIKEMDASKEYERVNSFYPLTGYFGSTLSNVLSLFFFGVMGTMIRFLVSHVITNTAIEQSSLFSSILLGGILGISILILASVLPEFKYQSGNDKVYFSLALFIGIYTEEFLAWLKEQFKRLFSAKKTA